MPEGMGRVTFATSLIAYFNMFAQLGIPTYGIRACARVRDDRMALSRTVQEIFLVNLLMTVLSYLALVIALLFVPRLRDDRTLYLIVSLSILFNTIGMEWLYKALEQYTYITIRSIIFKCVAVAAMFLLVHAQKDYVIYGGISILAASASNIFNFINAHRFVDFKLQDGLDLRRNLKPVLVFFGMSFATMIYLHLDTVMLGFMKSDADVGYYNTAVKIKTILVSVVTSLGAVLLPRCSYYVEHGLMEEFRRICRKALNFVYILALPLMVYFIMYAAQGIRFLSGPAYDNSIIPMQIIMPTLLFIGFSNILGIQVLIPLGREKDVLVSEFAGAVVDLIINFLLIPKYASAGAAFGTTVAEAVVLAVQCRALKEEVPGLFGPIRYWKGLLAAFGGVFASFWVPQLGLGTFLTLAVSAVLFFGVYGSVLLLLKEQMMLDITGQAVERIKKYLPREGSVRTPSWISKEKMALIYLVGCELYIFTAIVFASRYSFIPHQHLIFSVLRGVCYLAVLVKIGMDFVQGQYTLKDILVFGSVGIFLLISTYITKNKNPLIYWVFIAAGHDVDYRKIIKWAALAHFAAVLLVVLSCYGGILENINFPRADGTARESLGFSYTSEPANFFFYGILLWVCFRKKDISLIETVLMALVVMFFYWKTDTKSPFVLSILALCGAFILKYNRWLRDYHKAYTWISYAVVPLCAAFVILVTFHYDPGVPWMAALNRLVTNRFRWGHLGVETFGVKLLGQNITWVGGEMTADYNYVDSSFVQYLLNFGPIFLGLLIAGLMALGGAISRHKDSFFLLVFGLFIVHSTFDPQLIVIAFNSFLLAYSYVTETVESEQSISEKDEY